MRESSGKIGNMRRARKAEMLEIAEEMREAWSVRETETAGVGVSN